MTDEMYALEIALAKKEGYLGGPENEREEMSPGFDPIAGITCWTKRQAAAHHMV